MTENLYTCDTYVRIAKIASAAKKENEKKDENNYKFFNSLTSSTNTHITKSICKKYIYDLGNDTLTQIKTLYHFYKQYGNSKLNEKSIPDVFCRYTENCANIYKEHIENYPTDQDALCTKLQIFKSELMHRLKTSNIFSAQKEIITIDEQSKSQFLLLDQGEVSTPLITFSTFASGTVFGISLLLFIFYKVTPYGFWISPKIRKIKKQTNIVDEEENESLYHYSISSQNNSINKGYNIPYLKVEK
ncbi:PIR Superfamily Protein [Plasmodium ovale wallikeri]|uniref:PIR Superfamily Protein n=1 Tax=Plasmodium ovale wallikeri TaxID=864142 RepID=A0A1A9AHX2_PLAOA|nr:PIR Superfamily Protein [Plasmodium ovale wallikeri]